MKSFRQSDFYHTWFKPCKSGRLQAGGEARGLRTSFVKLVINLTIFPHHNSFFNSSISGRVLRNSSGISDEVLKVATPIGLS